MRRRFHVGEDILLVRHGSNIRKLRYERGSNTVTALLHDGSVDTVSNIIDPAPVGRAESRPTVAASSARQAAADPSPDAIRGPAGSAPERSDAHTAGSAAAASLLDADDWKFLRWVGGVGIGLSLALAGVVTVFHEQLISSGLLDTALTMPPM